LSLKRQGTAIQYSRYEILLPVNSQTWADLHCVSVPRKQNAWPSISTVRAKQKSSHNKANQLIDPQENITIGNFLFALGLCIGTRKGIDAPVGTVNLLQQTSYDHPLGDVMLHFPGVTRLIEFKRGNRRHDRKEKTKHGRLCDATRNLSRKAQISREIHWYVQTASTDKEEFIFSARPYLDQHDQTVAALDMTAFVNNLIDQALSPTGTVSTNEANEYISDILLPFGTMKNFSSTGLIVTVSSSGGLMYAVVDDLADLKQTRKQCLGLQLRRYQELENILGHIATHEAALAREAQQRKAPQIDRSHGLSL
jgi:hypothetical protein